MKQKFSLGCKNNSSPAVSEDPAARNPLGAGPAPVVLAPPGFSTVTPGDLGASGSYAILAKTGISITGVTAITGHIGVSPAAATYITGFGLVVDASTEFATSSVVVGGGRVYAADYGPPTPSNMTITLSGSSLPH